MTNTNTRTNTRATLALCGALLFAMAGTAQAATPKADKGTATCADGMHGTKDKTGCAATGTKAMPSGANSSAVETQSSKVSATGDAPTTGGASKTPGKPDPMAK